MKIKKTVLKILLAQFLMMVCASIASAQYIQLLGYTNQTWRYNDTTTTGSNPEGLFQAPGFDDTVAGWKTGLPLFGNDDPGVYNGVDDPFSGGLNGFATPLDRTGGRITFYFRTHFNLASPPAAGATLYSTNYLDDSAAYYLNGVDIGRMRLVAGPLTWDTLGSNPPTEGIAYRIDFPPEAIAALQVGDNLLAVEVHQSSAGSSDAAFAMNLILINPFCVTILDAAQPADVSVVQNRAFTLRAVADASPPITYQWVKDGTDITGANSATYTVNLAALTDEGNYYCRISNPVCTVSTRTNFVDVIQDLTPPELIGALAPNFTSITVQFNEAMDPGTTLDAFSWAILDPTSNPVPLQEPGGITLSANGAIVTLQIASGTTLLEDAVYTVTITAPTDLAMNSAPADATTTFRTFTTAGCNRFLFEAFHTASTPGNAITLLTSHPDYPNSPTNTFLIPSFDSRNGYPSDANEQYGGRIRGLFVPNITGPWTFYLASDDASQLFVNPTGPDSAGKQLVAQELNCCNNFVPTGDPKTSVPINLTAGQAYYVEALYKEGTGGDWLKVAARPSGDPVPVGGNSEAGTVSAGVIQAGAGGPAGILSSITIASQPGNQSVIAGQVARFSVGLSLDVPGCFQWKKDGVDIPGAVGPTYHFTTSLADDNTHYSVQVSLMGGTVLNSSAALLHVFLDTTPPTVTNVTQDLAGNLTLSFSEPLDLNTATNPANYQIDGVPPAAASASANNVIFLTPAAPMAPCPVNHSVTVSNVRDANTVLISPNPTVVTVTLDSLLLLPINALTIWRYNDSGEEFGDAWYASGYDDSGWSNGAPTFAFPATEGPPALYPVRTTLAGVRLTTYFRKHFNMPAESSGITNLQLNIILDDGGVIYLNGQELTRIRMAAGPVSTNTLTTAGQPGADPPQILETYNLPANLLQNGDNVIAARVHQNAVTSSDEVFSAAILAQSGCAAPRPRLSIARNGNQVTITSTMPGTIYRAPSLSGPWAPVGAAPQTVNIATAITFFEIRP